MSKKIKNIRNVANMTAVELRALADEKEQEELNQNKIIKTGTLKDDLYSFNCRDFEYAYHLKTDVNKICDLALVAKKGTEFFCWLNDGREIWAEESGDIDLNSQGNISNWLTNIKPVEDKIIKKKKK